MDKFKNRIKMLRTRIDGMVSFEQILVTRVRTAYAIVAETLF
jgi:hypothetical protein